MDPDTSLICNKLIIKAHVEGTYLYDVVVFKGVSLSFIPCPINMRSCKKLSVSLDSNQINTIVARGQMQSEADIYDGGVVPHHGWL
jgi:hypothetical protein